MGAGGRRRNILARMLDARFGIAAAGSTAPREAAAGVATFLSMAYVAVANPAILSAAGMDFGGVFIATCLAAAVGSLAMGLLANYPVALAPGMGQNAFFAHAVVLGMGVAWPTALGAVFVSGVLFLLLGALPVREWLINSIPRDLKHGMTAGIGLFLAFIALRNAGIVDADAATLVAFGELAAFAPVAAVLGFALILALQRRGVPGAMLIGMGALAAAGWLLGDAPLRGIAAWPAAQTPVAFQLDIPGALDAALIGVVLSLLLLDVFDTAGTLVGVATRAGLVAADGRLPRLRGALLADAGATVFGAVAGTSSTTSYIESAAGVEAGGRTGLAAVVAGLLFLLCLPFAPLAESVPAYAAAAALLVVAVGMARSFGALDWSDPTSAGPGAAMAIAMPLGFSIADGIGFGFIAYAAAKVLSGRPRQCPAAVYAVAAVFAAKFALE